MKAIDIEKLIRTVRERHPYPEDVFPVLDVRGRKPYVDCMLNAGLSVDRYSAELMRMGWLHCVAYLETLIKEEEARK